MRVVRLHAPDQLVLEDADPPRPGPGDALVRVHAAAITRGELEWPVDRLPAIPSYELSGVVESGVAAGEEVFALTPFDRDGVAADYTAVPAELLVPKPRTLGHAESAAIPLPALTAWQGLLDHGAYFVVEPNRDQLTSIARLADAGELRPPPVVVFPLASAREAFARSLEAHGPGKIVLAVA